MPLRLATQPLTACLSPVPQNMIGQDKRNHGFSNRHRADADARIVPAFCENFRLPAMGVDGAPRRQN
jgi:hypothetical protein